MRRILALLLNGSRHITGRICEPETRLRIDSAKPSMVLFSRSSGGLSVPVSWRPENGGTGQGLRVERGSTYNLGLACPVLHPLHPEQLCCLDKVRFFSGAAPHRSVP